VFVSLVIILFSCLFLVGGACAEPKREAPVVIANGEELQGAWEVSTKEIAVFRGVPFAQPPLGDLRWRAPLANLARTGPQKATGFAPGCMQTSYSTDWYARVAAAFGYGPEAVDRPLGVSEDCLYLNVWTPALNKEANLPVMVWVHGGSNKGGWSYEPNYIGTNLAARGVVVVNIAYRMGAFGFFSHPDLDNGEGQPIANFGLLDVARAFHWVKDNIESFGGDPKNITLIGESSGAGDISDLVAIGIDQDQMYQRVILQSSASGLIKRRTLEQEQALGTHLINGLAIKEPITQERLRSIPAKELLAAYMSELQDHYFDAVIDGLTMQQSPIESFRRMQHSKLDVLIGTNADEWYMYIDEKVSQSDLERLTKQRSGDNSEDLMAELDEITDVRRAIDRVRTAGDTLCPSRYLAARVSETGGRAWVYYFSRQRSGPGGETLGAYHGTEIPYVFDMHDDWLPSEEIDRELTKVVMDYWVQFARTGDPNISNHPKWPVYTAGQATAMKLGDRVEVMHIHDQGLCKLLGPGKQQRAQ